MLALPPDAFSRLIGRPVGVGHLRVTMALAIVLVLSSAVNLIDVLGTSIFYQPDSGNYVISGYDFAFNFSLSSVNLNRVPGYPILEAPIYRFFGPDAMYALKCFQHLLMVAVSGIVVALGDQFDRSRRLGFFAGLFSCFALQLHSYAHQPMTEVPYGLAVALGVLLALRWVRGGSTAVFLAALAVFGISTLIRPTGVLLGPMLIGIAVLRGLFPQWTYLWPAGGRRGREIAWRQVALGAIVAATLWAPWPVYNLHRYDHFGMTATFGQNLWSNVVEYGQIWDNDSPSVQDIHRRWDEYQEQRVASGQPVERQFTWRSHHPTTSAYMAVTGADFVRTNAVMAKGALQSIRKYPGRFLRHVLHNLYVTVAIAEPTYLYAPDTGEEDIRPRSIRSSFSLSAIEATRANIEKVMADAGMGAGKIVFHPGTIFTPLYLHIALTYHDLASNQTLSVTLITVGGMIACALIFSRRGLPWLMLVTFLVYAIVFPMIVVPGAPRHRLPTDPELQILYALIMQSALVAAVRAWRHRARLPQVAARLAATFALGYRAPSPREILFRVLHGAAVLLLIGGLLKVLANP